MYNIDSMKLAMNILGTKSKAVVYEHLIDELSLYSVEYEDGREIISESFSAFYGDTGNRFAERFLEKCKDNSMKGR